MSDGQAIDLLAAADDASVDRLVERVSRAFERKLRIERERRGR